MTDKGILPCHMGRFVKRPMNAWTTNAGLCVKPEWLSQKYSWPLAWRLL
jgi:hypothetical protein